MDGARISGCQFTGVPYPQETAELGSRGDSVERSKADPCSGNRLVRDPLLPIEQSEVQRQVAKVKRTFKATAHWQVVGSKAVAGALSWAIPLWNT